MSLKIYQVDAFTDRPFAGNPAAVCLLPEPRQEDWMQAVAAEMNLAETAFLLPEGDGYRLRWFTPTIEVDLCGHATLASAHILWEQSILPEDSIAQFYTRSGLLTAERCHEGIMLDFPVEPESAVTPPSVLMDALGVKIVYAGKNRFDYLIELNSEEGVRSVKPNFNRLTEVESRGVIVTARSENAEYDFISRFFAPAAGINEDPVTGSAHCCLGPFWQKRLLKDELIGFQASARGGVVRVRLAGDRVKLIGQAVTVLRCDLLC